jgi:CelD/BcsL family acetyltransferase involved in cellulose biosynthesis
MPPGMPVTMPAAAPSHAAAPLRCQVLTDWDQVQPFAAAWDSLIQRVGGDIYFTLDWCRMWWCYYGQGRRLRLFLFWDGPTLVSLLPMMVDRLWLGPVPVRLAKFVGADFAPIVLNPPVAPEHAVAVYTHALRHLLVDQGCDAAWFGPLAGHRPHHREALRQACQAASPAVQILRDRDAGVHTIFHLPSTFEQYLGLLSGSDRGNFRRCRRKLDSDYKIQVDRLETREQVEPRFQEFLTLHATHWRSQGMLGHFDDWPHAEPFNRDLIRVMAPQARLWLLRLASGEQTLSYEYSFRLGDWLYWRLPARRAGQPWDNLGVGRVSLITLFQEAIAAGIQHIEGGPGHYDYKLRLAGTEYPLGSMLIVGGTARAQAKTRLLNRWADLLHLLYYRIWFSRIAPHLPLPRRPLWRIWVRSHL